MLKSHMKFHSKNGKRQILVADDELINREILGEILKSDYEVLFAADGKETLEMIRKNRSTLSLVLLDIMMPVMSGLEVLKAVREDAELSRIPVIVMTAERDTEVESLRLGATDFIPKPYPDIDVIHARLQRTIELFEDRDIIQSTERDSLTGLYNREYFFRYAEQFDQYHPDTETDAVVVDINHFRMINERYGKAYGDVVLRQVGGLLRDALVSEEGIVCRREADTFLAYCSHREDYEAILENASAIIAGEDTSENRVRLRMGIYSCTDKSIDMERRFDRAKMAADTVKETFSKAIGIYDNSLHERQIYDERLIEDFSAAIREKQFKVFYQPKFDVRPDTPVLASAEALVRWEHPELGMVSPGRFIKLFEENGMVERLDTYVWQETARQIRDWKDRLGYAVPISVNVSRIDMYDLKLPEILQGIVQENGLTGQDFLLEVTESAYTQDSEKIIAMVENLRRLGFQIEMDDFGTGYSSLNMISRLPIDALKLDMQFIRNAFKEGGNTHILEVIIGISDYLSVPVIAEGVETEEQLHALKAFGCEIVQGYFFSKPVPAREFEAFILQKKEADLAKEAEYGKEGKEHSEDELLARKAKLNVLKEQSDRQKDSAVPEPQSAEEEPAPSGIRLKTTSIFFTVLAFIAAVALLVVDVSVTSGYQRMDAASIRYIAAQQAAADLENGSDYLTDRVRCFVITGNTEYLNDYLEEIEVTRRRDKAVETLEELLEESDRSAVDSLNAALSLSNELVETENRAFFLILKAENYDLEGIPENITDIQLQPDELAMSPEELRRRAQDLVFDSDYKQHKDRIRENVDLCTQTLIRSSSQGLDQASRSMSFLLTLQTVLTVVLFLIILGIILVISRLVRRPLIHMVQKMQKQEEIEPTGVEELRIVARSYNRILQENSAVREKLSREASHDALTGLFNRGAYDLLMESSDKEHMALILLDVDYFKSVNDTYGHAVGDRVLKRVAELMRASFRSVDILCRIGGDEFVVVMTRVNSSMSMIVRNKINRINDLLQHPKDDLPPVSLSVGVAFSDRKNPQGDIFRDADTALYKVKEAGRRGCYIFE